MPLAGSGPHPGFTADLRPMLPAKDRLLTAGRTFSWQWICDGDRVASSTWPARVSGSAQQRADRTRRRLGRDPGSLNGSGDEPKGMQWRTFDRLMAEHDAGTLASLVAMGNGLNYGEVGQMIHTVVGAPQPESVSQQG